MEILVWQVPSLRTDLLLREVCPLVECHLVVCQMVVVYALVWLEDLWADPLKECNPDQLAPEDLEAHSVLAERQTLEIFSVVPQAEGHLLQAPSLTDPNPFV